jgi:aspartate carbamoyltransferase catalytic subunit
MTRQLVSIQDLSDDDIRAILDDAAAYDADPTRHRGRFADKILCTAFFEPSTRTRLSFESAAHRLGARVIGFSDAASTSSQKGETLEDTVRILGGYADALVLRHPERGAAIRAAAVSSVPVVNAGDGDGEHPTQTLLDLYTIRKSLGRIQGVKVAVVGDLRFGRTVHSLLPALSRLGAEAVAVPAPGLGVPDDMGDVPVMDLAEAASACDVLYVTRVQRERFLDAKAYEAVRGSFLVDRDLLERTGSKATILHPLPRVGEVATDVDELPAAKYFDQARNGVPVRMAVLARLFEELA